MLSNEKKKKEEGAEEQGAKTRRRPNEGDVRGRVEILVEG